jgi:hypothetical protein
MSPEIKTALNELVVKIIGTLGSRTMWAIVLLTLNFLQKASYTMESIVAYLGQMLVICGVFKANDVIDIVKAKNAAAIAELPPPAPPAA